jgi:hypothetical protein
MEDEILPPTAPELPHPAPPVFTVPLFSHGPPPAIQGRDRWPTAPDHQAVSSTSPCTLHDIFVLITPFLADSDVKLSTLWSTAYRYGTIGTSLAFTRPWSPYRRRRWGFGIPSSTRSATHDSPSSIGMLHFVWPFLQPADRWSCYQVCQPWRSYIKLRRAACRSSIASLRRQRMPPSSPSPKKLCLLRANIYAHALLRFHFIYGDFV